MGGKFSRSQSISSTDRHGTSFFLLGHSILAPFLRVVIVYRRRSLGLERTVPLELRRLNPHQTVSFHLHQPWNTPFVIRFSRLPRRKKGLIMLSFGTSSSSKVHRRCYWSAHKRPILRGRTLECWIQRVSVSKDGTVTKTGTRVGRNHEAKTSLLMSTSFVASLHAPLR